MDQDGGCALGGVHRGEGAPSGGNRRGQATDYAAKFVSRLIKSTAEMVYVLRVRCEMEDGRRTLKSTTASGRGDPRQRWQAFFLAGQCGRIAVTVCADD
ncbi:hypothetical protein BOS5A_200013 [Bosea sp. EC-HK365B]|nr:hypothetical protein BOS5A_200013 [Bosea sp. EC-HK365B]